jgi:putative transposase
MPGTPDRRTSVVPVAERISGKGATDFRTAGASGDSRRTNCGIGTSHREVDLGAERGKKSIELAGLPVMIKRQIVDSLRGQYPVNGLCEMVNLERSTYYYQPTEKDDLSWLVLIKDVIRKHPTWGYRMIAGQLRYDGYQVNEKRIYRVMRENDLVIHRRKRGPQTTDSTHRYGRYPNLLRSLTVDHPDQVWCADITYIHMGTRYVYLAVLLDVFTRSLRGWHLGKHLDTGLVMKALRPALQQRCPEIHHSDQGIQYAAHDYVDLLRSFEIQPSMSATGRPTDNAFVERVIRTIKEEEVYLNEYTDFTMAYQSIGHFIDVVYQTKRIHSSLGYITPADYESAYFARYELMRQAGD